MFVNKNEIAVVFCKHRTLKECPFGGISHKPIFIVFDDQGVNFNFSCNLVIYFCVSVIVKSPLAKIVAAKVFPSRILIS